MKGTTEFFTLEYRDLCTQYTAFMRSPHGHLIDGTSFIRVSNYANYWFCPLSYLAEQAKLEPLWVPTEEDLREEEASKLGAYAQGTANHTKRAIEISKTHPNTPVSDGMLQPSSLVIREEARKIVASIVDTTVKGLKEKEPERVITKYLLKSIERDAIRVSPNIDPEVKTLVERVDTRERLVATKPKAGSQELHLLLLRKGIWISGHFDGAYFEGGKVAKVDEFKSSSGLSRLRAHVAQSELYCLMLSRATGQTGFPYTLSLGKREVPISKDWEESRVLQKLDTVIGYFTGKIEAKLLEGFTFGMCDGCFAIQRCPVREKLRKEQQERAHRVYEEHQIRVRALREGECNAT